MGVQAALGRLLQPSTDLPSAAPVTVLEYGFWQSEFGGDRSVVGKTIDLDSIPLTVVFPWLLATSPRRASRVGPITALRYEE